jgi:hypothetical protein
MDCCHFLLHLHMLVDGCLLSCSLAAQSLAEEIRKTKARPPAARTQTVPALLLQRSCILSCSHAWRILKGPKKYSMLILPTTHPA